MPTRKHTPSYLWSYGTAPIVTVSQRWQFYDLISGTNDSATDAISIRRVKGFLLPSQTLETASSYARGFWGFIYQPSGTDLEDPNSGTPQEKADITRRVFGAMPWVVSNRLSVPFAAGPTKFWIPRGASLSVALYTDVISAGNGVQMNISMTGRYKMYRRDTGQLLDRGGSLDHDPEDDDEEG